jgi:hypothetical protein
VFDASSLLGGPRAKRAAIVIVSINSFPFPLSPLYFPLRTWHSAGRRLGGGTTEIERRRLTPKPSSHFFLCFLSSPFPFCADLPLILYAFTHTASNPNPNPNSNSLDVLPFPQTACPNPTLPSHRNTLHVDVDVDRRTARSSTSPSRTSLLRLPSLRPIRS